MTYDKIDRHTGNKFPKNLSFANGGTHIGIFLAWIINNDLLNEMHLENSKEAVNKVKSKIITGRDFLIRQCESKFSSEDLNEMGNKFATFYYADQSGYGKYIDDYADIFSQYESLYHVEDNWKNYGLMATIITRDFLHWKKNKLS
ncbi:hypothetical protein [Flavobacterium sp. '19STA2R22 D10 B1']|uniref:DUF7832 domain-containing protein n=1 Tax=Flavobacterium aerium TaxID=3037261 RepID=UPI00278BD2CF|nr:hypothetical protein [Flavobacterium sp. '19STA2R22 D10 B1']